MALHMLRSTPSFTVTLRGYDKDEVDEYIESLRDGQEGDAEALADADSRVQFLDSEVRRMTGRVSDLERALRSETPRSIGGLGERLVLILDQAEAGANETVALAQSEADGILAEARQAGEAARHEAEKMTGEAQARAANTCKTAEQTAWRLEHEAQLRADEIIRQSEAQAEARISEIEQWAAQVRAQITSDQVRAREEFARVKARRDSEIRDLVNRRDSIISGMDGVSNSLQKAISEARQVTGRRPGEEKPGHELEEHPATSANSAIEAAPNGGSDQPIALTAVAGEGDAGSSTATPEHADVDLRGASEAGADEAGADEAGADDAGADNAAADEAAAEQPGGHPVGSDAVEGVSGDATSEHPTVAWRSAQA